MPQARPAGRRMRAALAGGRWRALLLSVVLAAAGYLGFSLWGGWPEVRAAVARVGGLGALALLGLSLLNYGLRFLRWQFYLRVLGAPQPWRPSLSIYLAGFALTTTPGKAGEALRSVFLLPRGVPCAASMAAFVSERVSDLLAILLLACLGLAAHPGLIPLVAVGAAATLGLMALLGRERTLLRWHQALEGGSSRLRTGLRHALGALLAARRCHRAAVLLPATALSLAAWSAEAGALHLLLHWLGMDTRWVFSFFVYAVGMLAGALSFLPGGLGGAEAAMVGLLLLDGQSQPAAVAATVVIRLATLWFAVALGLLALGRLLWHSRAPAAAAAGGRP